MPEENYWFQRHLVVYERIAEQVAGRRVVDLACGEGYGTAVLGRTAASVVGVDANPEAFEHARLKYERPGVRFERWMVESWEGDVDTVVFLQTIEHVQDPHAVLEHVKRLIGPDGVAYISTPNVRTLAPEGEERSGNPWHVKEYRADEFRALCSAHFRSVELYGLFHAGKLWLHELAIRHAGWPRPAERGQNPFTRSAGRARRLGLGRGAPAPGDPQVHLANGVNDKPRQVLLRQPVAHVRRHQKRLIAITRDEALPHPDMVLTPPDGPGLMRQPQATAASPASADSSSRTGAPATAPSSATRALRNCRGQQHHVRETQRL